MMRKKGAFSIVELLTVLAIIAMITGILLPSLAAVRTAAKSAKTKSQLATIEMCINAFKNDDGDYPPSKVSKSSIPPNPVSYVGANKLAEALLGWDLMGFHPDSQWQSNGRTADLASQPIYDNTPANLMDRIGPYLDVHSANAFRIYKTPTETLPGLYTFPTGMLQQFVLCDSFGRREIVLGGKKLRAGTPILYYKANTNSVTMVYTGNIPGNDTADNIYNVKDNYALVALGPITEDGSKDSRKHSLIDDGSGASPVPEVLFRNYIANPNITTGIDYPYRPDSFILISAGPDGIYGNRDDITNFK